MGSTLLFIRLVENRGDCRRREKASAISAWRSGGPDRRFRTACCAAQMFLDTGDGIVFKGEFGPWYSPGAETVPSRSSQRAESSRRRAQHLRRTGGEELTEIFLHSRSTINAENSLATETPALDGVKIVGVRVRTDFNGVKMFRSGEWPVIRGTFWRLNDRTGYLWASGFKPSLLTYDGWEVPTPLRIDIEHGDADLKQVATDIFGLTKLNYNTCKLGDSLPVTVGFSDAVGEILIANPGVKAISPSLSTTSEFANSSSQARIEGLTLLRCLVLHNTIQIS